MTDKPVPLTREGKAKLEHELEQLRARRREVAEMIHNAQEQGTSQNDAEYDDAKMEQGRVEGRILEVEDILRRARDHRRGWSAPRRPRHDRQRSRGRTGRRKRRHYQIVGAPEADPANGKISNESPVGAALLGKAVGDIGGRQRAQGVIKVKVLKID